MPELTLNLSVDKLKKLLFQLPPRDFLELAESVNERAETIEMMQLAETGFREWLEEGEDIYDEAEKK